MTPLLDVEAQFVSLQKNARESDLATLRERSDILDAAPQLESFADTAALIQHLDLVISVDTSVAHLAGALGLPVWILLPYVPDFRWLLDRDDSPWYPTARLFRQTATRDYADVLDRVRTDLNERIAASRNSK
jgi:ADP-heptose:LPS heptosyltransferase